MALLGFGTDHAIKVDLFLSLIEEYRPTRFEEVGDQIVLLLESAIVCTKVVDVLCEALEIAVTFVWGNCGRLIRHVGPTRQVTSAIKGDSEEEEREEGRKKEQKKHGDC